MKAKYRKTGEIVDIICYGDVSAIKRSSLDWINYIDSHGVEHLGEKLNYYWDFEPIEEDITHWQDVRERAAIAALQGILANTKLVDNLDKPGWNAARAVQHADELIKYLKME